MEQAPPLRRISPNLIDIDQLEPVPSGQFQSLDPAVRWLWMVGPVILWGIIGTVLTTLGIVNRVTDAFLTDSGANHVETFYFPVVAFIGILAIWHFCWPWVSYPKYGFAIRRNDLLIRYGVIWKRVVAVPFSRIQHVDSSAGPLSRMLGVASVDIHTAGTAMSKISIPGLESKHAEAMRDYLSKVGHTHANI